MDSSLWVAKTGLDAQQRRMTVVANNLSQASILQPLKDRYLVSMMWSKGLIWGHKNRPLSPNKSL